MNQWKIYVLIGMIFLFIGGLVYFRVPIGKLPGDIFIDKGSYKLYIPLGTGILISILLSVFWMLVMFWKR